MPVWLSQGAVSGLIKNTAQLVDGEKTNFSGSCRVSAPAEWANAQKKAQRGYQTAVKSVKWVSQKNIIAPEELL